MADAFRSRLARLRRDGARLREQVPHHGEPPAVAPVRPAGLPAWVGARLAKRRSGLTAGPGASGAFTPALTPELERIAALWPVTTGDPQGLVESRRAEGAFFAREQRLGVAGTRHGEWELSEIDAADGAAIARLTQDDALRGLDLRRAVYLDTETSGLSGGAGVYVYMVGLGVFDGDEYVSWQGFLRHPGEERALLAEVADRIAGSAGMVSFFGKSFDRHRLQDKMRIHGVTPPFDGRPHLDLYHPFRRLTQGALLDGKLQTMERELLGFRREKDLPGSLAPAAWFDYLAERPHRLEGVFLHNHEDVLSLVALAAFLGRSVAEVRASGAALSGPAARRALALCETSSDAEERLAWARCALERGATGTDRRRMLALRATLLRRGGDVEAARSAYREALEESAEDRVAIELFVGASMLLEHAVGDRENALRMAERALDLARRLGATERQLAELAARAARLGT